MGLRSTARVEVPGCHPTHDAQAGFSLSGTYLINKWGWGVCGRQSRKAHTTLSPGLLKRYIRHRWADQERFGSRKEVSVLATVTLRDGESQENLLKRFRKEVMQERILSEARRKRWYISPSEMRRIQKQRAIRRARRRQRQRDARRRY
jgi:small subunit ribosomal protein S21